MNELILILIANIVTLDKVGNSIGMKGARNGCHSCWFVDNQEMIVFVQDFQIPINGFQGFITFLRGNINRYLVSDIQKINGILFDAID